MFSEAFRSKLAQIDLGPILAWTFPISRAMSRQIPVSFSLDSLLRSSIGKEVRIGLERPLHTDSLDIEQRALIEMG